MLVRPVEASPSPYDAIAEYYQSAWADWFLPSVRPALEKLFFPTLRNKGRVLDVCCGCGHVTQELVARGYSVVGLDNSKELIYRASNALPGATFVVADVRDFHLPEQFDGILSTFDSLNHLLSYEDLASAFRCVKASLRAGAPFFFDMNLEDAYSLDLGDWSDYKREDAIGFVRGTYDPVAKRARTELIWFLREEDGKWNRFDAQVEEQCYSLDEIRKALAEANFRTVEWHTPSEAGVTDELGFGRVYVRAWA
jgi:SAM-dependent methyltransferase